MYWCTYTCEWLLRSRSKGKERRKKRERRIRVDSPMVYVAPSRRMVFDLAVSSGRTSSASSDSSRSPPAFAPSMLGPTAYTNRLQFTATHARLSFLFYDATGRDGTYITITEPNPRRPGDAARSTSWKTTKNDDDNDDATRSKLISNSQKEGSEEMRYAPI